MAKDPVKSQLNNIIDTAVQTFKDYRANDTYDFTASAKAMAQEAFDLGVKVGQGKLPAPEGEPAKAGK